MKQKLCIFLLMQSFFVYSYEYKIVSKDQFNDKEPISSPTIVIDMFGNPDWKYPLNFFIPKEIIKQEKKNNTSKNQTKPDVFKKGRDEKYSLGLGFSFMGSMHGPKADIRYYSGNFSHGLNFKLFSSEKWSSNSVTNYTLVDYSLNIHAFPQWYINSSLIKSFDSGLKIIAGVGRTTNKTENSTLTKNDLYYGLGAFTRYPLGELTRIQLDFDILDSQNKKSNYGSAISLSIGVDF